MVKLTQTRKFNYENLSGGKISLEITKNGASVVIVIKQDYASALWSNKISFMTEMLALVFIYMFFDRRIVFLCIFVMCVLIIYQLNVVQEGKLKYLMFTLLPFFFRKYYNDQVFGVSNNNEIFLVGSKRFIYINESSTKRFY